MTDRNRFTDPREKSSKYYVFTPLPKKRQERILRRLEREREKLSEEAVE